MAIRKNLTKVGNSSALVIDKNVLELLNIDSNTPVEITMGADGQSLILTPIRDEADNRRRFEKAKNEGNKKYGGAYKKLASR